ncbi:MAG: hypothetical protein K6D91_03740 [Prevotella sp.]|nr:hypothetical protein [Prevotella sp.]
MKRIFTAWTLLLVFSSMLLVTSFHIHEREAQEETECSDCVRHSCQGHLTNVVSWSHDCVLCQFLTLTYVATGAIVISVLSREVCVSIAVRQYPVRTADSGIVGLRAPPAFSI